MTGALPAHMTPASKTANPIPSSSPAFATPAHPIRPFNPAPAPAAVPTLLPIVLPPAALRPLAFRTFTKKHSLNLTSSALQALATFIGKHCGAEWRQIAEPVLEDIAKNWKKAPGGVIVDGDGNELKNILKNLEGRMSGGRIIQTPKLSRQSSSILAESQEDGLPRPRVSMRPDVLSGYDSPSSLGVEAMDLDDEDEDNIRDPRKWLKVIGAFDMPRLTFNPVKKNFEEEASKTTLFTPPFRELKHFRHKYGLIHHRLLRDNFVDESSSMDSGGYRGSITSAKATSIRLTPIFNLLGRNGSNHTLLGLLSIAPNGSLAITDLTGSINLDLSEATVAGHGEVWFSPGMVVLVDGVYEEGYGDSRASLGQGQGSGFVVPGIFFGHVVGSPPAEERHITLGVASRKGDQNGEDDFRTRGGFGWVDYLGVGSERAVGPEMIKIQQRVLGNMRQARPQNDLAVVANPSRGRTRVVIIGEIALDISNTHSALEKIFSIYAASPEDSTPMTFILMGNFVSQPIMARSRAGGSVEYKEYFDSLASLLSGYPSLLQTATFVFVPGDNDGYESSFSGGAASILPHRPVPSMYTSRVKRAFTTANAEAEKETGKKTDGEAIWTTNPARLSLFGPVNEIVLLRDDMSGRFRRSALVLKEHGPSPDDAEEAELIREEQPKPAFDPRAGARKLVKTVLDQGYLSPFPVAKRPVLLDAPNALSIDPLPTALVLADAEMNAFCETYVGCHVMNPGSMLVKGRGNLVRWLEYDVKSCRGTVKEERF